MRELWKPLDCPDLGKLAALSEEQYTWTLPSKLLPQFVLDLRNADDETSEEHFLGFVIVL